MAEPLFTRAELEARVSPTVLARCLDDSGQGDADQDAFTVLRDDCTTWVRGKLGPVFQLATLNADTAGDVKRIAMDVARAYLCERHPEMMRQDAAKIFERCAKDIKAIRLGESSLGTEAPPEPAANHGARVTSGNPDDPDCIPRRFSDNWGDFG